MPPSLRLAGALVLLVIAPSLARAQPAWIAERLERATDPAHNADLWAAFVHGPEDFRVAGSDDAGPFIAHWQDGAWVDEPTPTPELVTAFYEEGGTLYALFADATGAFDAFAWGAGGWEAAELTTGMAFATGRGFFVRDDDGLWVAANVDGGDVPQRRVGGAFVDLCLGTSAPYVAESGGAIYGISGLGYLFRYNDTGCSLRGVPGSDWESIDTDRLPIGVGPNNVRFVRGEYRVGQDRAVYTRTLSGPWSSFPVDIDRAIQFIAGPDADVYIGSRAGVLFDEDRRVTTEGRGGATANFLVHAVHWSADGTVVVVGENGHYLRREVTTPPPPVDEVRLAIAITSLAPMTLAEPRTADGAFEVRVDNEAAPIESLSFRLATSPPVNIPSVDFRDDARAISCTEAEPGVYDCSLSDLIGTLLDTGEQAIFEVPFVLRTDTTYSAGTVALDMTASATASDSIATGTADATGLYVLVDEHREADLAVQLTNGFYCDSDKWCEDFTVTNFGPDRVADVKVSLEGDPHVGIATNATCEIDDTGRSCLYSGTLLIGESFDVQTIYVESRRGEDRLARAVRVESFELGVTDPNPDNDVHAIMGGRAPDLVRPESTDGCTASGATRGSPPALLALTCLLAFLTVRGARRRGRCCRAS